MLFHGLLMFLKANSNGIAQGKVSADLRKLSLIFTLNKILRQQQHFVSHIVFISKEKSKTHTLREPWYINQFQKLIRYNQFKDLKNMCKYLGDWRDSPQASVTFCLSRVCDFSSQNSDQTSTPMGNSNS